MERDRQNGAPAAPGEQRAHEAASKMGTGATHPEAAQTETTLEATLGAGNEAVTEEPQPAAGEQPEEHSELAERRAQVEQVERALKEANARYVRLRADFDNYRRRTQAEADQRRDAAAEELITACLPLLDNLERAVVVARNALDGAAAQTGLVTGVDLVLQQWREILANRGVMPIPAVGEPFDPTLHEAVQKVAGPAGMAGRVAEELQRGYFLGERVLRPSVVSVVAESEPEAAQELEGDPEQEEAT